MTFDGSAAPSDGGGSLKPSPTVHGESIAFIGNEVTNRHTAICFAVGSEQYGRAPRVVIRRNKIHDCGRLPPTNHEHGIYLHSPCCAQVTDNWVYDNADTGIQMFPDADGNYIARNVVYGNGDNISFGGDSKDGGCASSDDNIVERNVLSHPRVKENVGSWSGCGKHGTGQRPARELHLAADVPEGRRGLHAAEQLLRRARIRERRGQGLPDRPGHALRAAGRRSRRRRTRAAEPGRAAARKLALQSNRRCVRIGRPLRPVGKRLAGASRPSGSGSRCAAAAVGPRPQRAPAGRRAVPRRPAPAPAPAPRGSSSARRGCRAPRAALRLRANAPGAGSSAPVRAAYQALAPLSAAARSRRGRCRSRPRSRSSQPLLRLRAADLVADASSQPSLTAVHAEHLARRAPAHARRPSRRARCGSCAARRSPGHAVREAPVARGPARGRTCAPSSSASARSGSSMPS